MPESENDEESKEQIAKISSEKFNSLPLRKVHNDATVLSKELILLVYLTMMGISFPL